MVVWPFNMLALMREELMGFTTSEELLAFYVCKEVGVIYFLFLKIFI